MNTVILILLNIFIILYISSIFFWTKQCETQYPRLFAFLYYIGLAQQEWNMFDDANTFCEGHVFRVEYEGGEVKDFPFYHPKSPQHSDEKHSFYGDYSESCGSAPWLISGIIDFLYRTEPNVSSVSHISLPHYFEPLNQQDQDVAISDYESMIDSRS